MRGRRWNVCVQGVCEWVLGRRSVCRWRYDEQVVVVVVVRWVVGIVVVVVVV